MIEEKDIEEVEKEVEKRFREADIEYVGFEWFYPSHLKLVKEEAEKLLEDHEDADERLTRLGAILHDIGYLKDHKIHEEVGFSAATELLDELDIKLSSKEKEKLEEVISEHGYDGNPSIIEAKIVAAADALAHLRPEFIATKSRVDLKNGRAENLKEFYEWLRDKYQKDLEKAQLLETSSRKAEKFRQLCGDFLDES